MARARLRIAATAADLRKATTQLEELKTRICDAAEALCEGMVVVADPSPTLTHLEVRTADLAELHAARAAWLDLAAALLEEMRAVKRR